MAIQYLDGSPQDESTPQVLEPQVLAPEDDFAEGHPARQILAPPRDDLDDENEAWSKPRGAVTRADGKVCIGRVGAPSGHEATSDEFWFWVPPDAVVEQTQIVTCESRMAGRGFVFYGVVEEVRRSSRARDMGREMDGADGDLLFEPPFDSEGCTYARVAILRAQPPLLTPPRERSDVLLAGHEEARLAYLADEIERPLEVGLVKNGGAALAGPGSIDLDYLLGQNGGHMNVNGAAGRGTKSSFLLWINWLLLREARRQARERPSDPERLRIVPIIFNVKNYDLFTIDHPSRRFKPEHAAAWREMGIDSPAPFSNVTFYAPQQKRGELPIATGRSSGVRAYSWSLRDVIEAGLLEYLFAEADQNDANFSDLIGSVEAWLCSESVDDAGRAVRRLRANDSQPTTFGALLSWVEEQGEGEGKFKGVHVGTWKKLLRRLRKIISSSGGVLRRDDIAGQPLKITSDDTRDPVVIDLNGLAGEPELQRFVVGAILRQLIEARTGNRQQAGLRYLVTLDELNRFAPKSARDPITRLIEQIAAEMRSQGVILLGAQQQASKVSEKVIENAGVRVLGKTGAMELSHPAWKELSESARRKAHSLPPGEKLIVQDSFREPLHVQVPFPAWALNREEAAPIAKAGGSAHLNGAARDGFADIFD